MEFITLDRFQILAHFRIYDKIDIPLPVSKFFLKTDNR